MKRLHLFEFEDLKWFPGFLRQGITDFLMFVFSKTNRYSPVIPLIKESLEKANINHIVDLCSGSGGGVENIRRNLNYSSGGKITLTLTDKYPNIKAFQKIKQGCEDIDFISESVDATNVPVHLKGFRTIFTAFHHFKPDMGEAILRDAVEKGVSIGIFELGNKGFAALLKLFITVPLGLFCVTPFLRPFKISKIIFTYLIPLIPLCTLWDGIVSTIRVYSPAELQKLTDKIGATNYCWKIGVLEHTAGPGKNKVIYLIGSPEVL